MTTTRTDSGKTKTNSLATRVGRGVLIFFYTGTLASAEPAHAQNGLADTPAPWTRNADGTANIATISVPAPDTRRPEVERWPDDSIRDRKTALSRRPSSARYDALIETVANEFQLDSRLLHAIIQVESNYDVQAISPKGAVGLMQVMPATARRFGFFDLTDPHVNVRAGAAYLKWLLGHFRSDLKLVIAAYNAGEGAVHRYGDRIPPYTETQNYVAQVLSGYQGRVQTPNMAAPSAASGYSPALNLLPLVGRLTSVMLSAPDSREDGVR
jgi:soluble lytic murein transglycosylase-like protein